MVKCISTYICTISYDRCNPMFLNVHQQNIETLPFIKRINNPICL